MPKNNALTSADPKKRERLITDQFLHELAILTLAETPIKSAVRNRAVSLRGELFYSIPAEGREVYLRSRDVLLEVARTLAQAETLEEVSAVLASLSSTANPSPTDAN